MAREDSASLAWGSRRTLAAVLAAVLAISAPAAFAADSAPSSRRFDIPQGDLGPALKAFSQQADQPVMTFADLSGKRAQRVEGVLAPLAALMALIRGQKLQARRVAGGFVIEATAKTAPTATPPTPAAAPTAVGEVETLVVTGFRETQQQARDLKREAVGSEEVILAEDIAAFPDLNLAESLQRIPGMTITRDSGEGRQIALRGLGPDFTRAQINGMEVLGNTASGMDNRGGVSRTRAFDYSLFASELFNKVTVQKSYAAELDEGGIGGTVQLETSKPFDYPGFKAVLSAKGQANSNVDGITPRLVGLISNRWGNFGALASVAYGTANSNEFGYRSFGWGQIHINPANIDAGVSAADAARLTSTGASEVFAPQADTLSTWSDRRSRLGATVAFQYEPGDRLKVAFDGLYSELRNSRKDYALAASGANGLIGNVTGTQVLQSDVIRGNSLVQASYTGVDLRSEENLEEDSTKFYQGGLHVSYQATGRLLLKGFVGYSKSDFALPVFDKVFLESQNHPFSFDDRPSMPVNTYGFNTTDPSQWNLMRMDTQENYISSAYANGKLDAVFAVNNSGALKAGVEYKKFVNGGSQFSDKEFHNVPLDTVIPASLKGQVPYDTITNYTVGDVNGTYPFIGQTRNIDSAAFATPGTNFTVTEETTAAYLQYDVDTTVADFPVKANAGLRYYSTDLTSAGTLNTGTSLQPVSISHNYSGLLPALNIAVSATHDLLLRFSANRDISRPALSDLAAAGSLTTAPFGGTISTGNPNLRPFTSDAVEGSVEFYQGRIGFFSVGLFYKKLDSFITTQTSVVPYASTGFPLSFLLPGQDGSILYNVSHPVNGPGAAIKGVEVALQRDFDFLPAPFNHLGVIANGTYADGSSPVIFSGAPINLPLLNLSKYTANATLYYETAKWGVRVSEAYRDKYLIGAGSNGNIGEGIEATNNIDFAAHYNVTPHLKATLEGINLTDQHIIQYTDITAKRIEVNTISGRTFAFGATFEF
ncbi:TonB-dependent receptor [Phenylobacterium sp.]|jgi:TonB-dependent receptor|uniref:TonB-dependent receptor n=1 Tax=Phenylobacterium sp. TaxID=1871053 RepID=UPI002E33B7DB|nr:TonB-dependent receptor [Phenylobacterium sp.]HEX3363910.1 TonB-dependent receptor [Phenylobacterium sp.]